jgi:hypothetical protein
MKIKFDASTRFTWRDLFHIGFERDVEEDYWICFAILGFDFNLRFFKKDSGWMPYYYSDNPYEDQA